MGKVGRRGFLAGAAIGVAAIGVKSLTGCDDGPGGNGGDTCPEPTSPWKWDREVDVVVVGAGTGLTAALAAAVAGSQVLVLEKSAEIGGSTKLSGGIAWVPNNPVGKAAGHEDSREDALAYLRKVARGQADDELLEAFVDGGPRMVSFVAQHTTLNWQVAPLLGDYHTEWPGAKVAGRSIGPDQGVVFQQGPELIQGLADGVVAAGGEILTGTPVVRLIHRVGADGTSEVLGVEALSEGAPLRIRANQGVVLAAGGFDWDPTLKLHFLRGPADHTLGHPGNTGDGVRMAMAVGADLRNMNECWGGVVYKAEAEALAAEGKPATLNALIQRRMPGCITVNRYGRRFCNEASPYDPAWLAFLGWENWGDLADSNLPAFHVSDKKSKPSTATGVFQADTLAELGVKMGVDSDALVATVAEFNNHVAAGGDPLFHRGESAYELGYGPTLAMIDKPPFFAVEVAPADLGTCGGPRVNGNAQVLNPLGQVIGRLYASGNNAGVGGPGAGYGGGGGTIGPAMAFAFLAGSHVAGLDPLVLPGDETAVG